MLHNEEETKERRKYFEVNFLVIFLTNEITPCSRMAFVCNFWTPLESCEPEGTKGQMQQLHQISSWIGTKQTNCMSENALSSTFKPDCNIPRLASIPKNSRVGGLPWVNSGDYFLLLAALTRPLQALRNLSVGLQLWLNSGNCGHVSWLSDFLPLSDVSAHDPLKHSAQSVCHWWPLPATLLILSSPAMKPHWSLI